MYPTAVPSVAYPGYASRAQSWSRRLARATITGILASELVVLANLPWNPAGASGLALLLVLPLTVSAGLLVELFVGTGRLDKPFLHGPRSPRSLQLFVVGASSMAVLALGMYAANRFLLDEWFDPITRMGYLVAALVAAAAARVVTRLVRRPAVTEFLLSRPAWLIPAVSFGLVGVASPFIDTQAMPPGYSLLHFICLATGVLGFAVLARLARQVLSRRLVRLSMAAVFAFLSVPALLTAEPAARLISRAQAGSYAHLLSLARSMADRDGDGYSAWLRGGDCDDSDPRAHPLSLVGRDCLGWVQAENSRPAATGVETPVRVGGPDIVVFLTIDAFRCGFGQFERPELRDVCPRLTELARSGRARFDARTPAPSTAHALSAIHFGWPGNRPMLSGLVAAGYQTHVVSTHRHVTADARIRDGLGTIDNTLLPVAALTNGVSAPAVSDRTLAWLNAQSRQHEKLFVWAHYFDPHAPYVSRPGAWFILSQLENYRAELQRVDREIGRLVDGIRSLPRANDVLVVITADHGEEFGEHGYTRHGTSLREEAVRIPFIVWSPGSGLDRFVPGSLPSSLGDVPSFMEAIVAGRRFQPSSEVTLGTRFTDDPQIGLVSDGWKLIHHVRLGYQELYHLASDPFERHDRALDEPGRVMMMGRRMTANLRLDDALGMAPGGGGNSRLY